MILVRPYMDIWIYPFHNSLKLISALCNAPQHKTVCAQLFSTQGVRLCGEELRGFQVNGAAPAPWQGWMEGPLEAAQCGGGRLWMARPTAHLRQHLLQLPKLVHVNQCYIPGIVTAYTAGRPFFWAGCTCSSNGKRNVGSPALTHFTLPGASGS